MFKNLELTPFKSRSAAARSISARCAKVPEKAIESWKSAWSVYQLDSYDQIPKLRCISIRSKNEVEQRERRIEEYKCLTVKHFLPVLKAKIPLLSGRAYSEAYSLVCDLEHWRQTKCLPCYTLPNSAVHENKQNILSTESRLHRKKPVPQNQHTGTCERNDDSDSAEGKSGEVSSTDSEFEFNFKNPNYEPLPGDVDFYIYDYITIEKYIIILLITN